MNIYSLLILKLILVFIIERVHSRAYYERDYDGYYPRYPRYNPWRHRHPYYDYEDRSYYRPHYRPRSRYFNAGGPIINLELNDEPNDFVVVAGKDPEPETPVTPEVLITEETGIPIPITEVTDIVEPITEVTEIEEPITEDTDIGVPITEDTEILVPITQRPYPGGHVITQRPYPGGNIIRGDRDYYDRRRGGGGAWIAGGIAGGVVVVHKNQRYHYKHHREQHHRQQQHYRYQRRSQSGTAISGGAAGGVAGEIAGGYGPGYVKSYSSYEPYDEDDNPFESNHW